MNSIIFLLIFSTFSGTIHGMLLEFKRKIQTFYEGDFRSVMTLYNKYIEKNETELVNPCRRYSEMEVRLDPREFTSIESDVITSLNTNMVLTLDGHSNFTIYAVMKCAVKKDNVEVFKFFVLLLPEWAKSFTTRDLDFIPVYSYESTDGDWELFAIKEVYDFQVLRSTFARNPQDQLRIRQSLESPRMIRVIKHTLNGFSKLSTAEVVGWKHHFDNFVLLLDEEGDIQIPAIMVFKLRVRDKFICYFYALIFGEDPSDDYPPDPFRYPSNYKIGFQYYIYNLGKTINGSWAFTLDMNLEKPRSNINLIPLFIEEIHWQKLSQL